MSWNKRRKRVISHDSGSIRDGIFSDDELVFGEPEPEEEPAEELTEEPEQQDNTVHAYWIHHRRHSESYARGYYSLPVCDCSACGYTAGIEKPVCPSCRAVMDAPVPDDLDAPYED